MIIPSRLSRKYHIGNDIKAVEAVEIILVR